MPSAQDENGLAVPSGGKVPRKLGGFELIEKIGQGGMGSVFKARQVDLDRLVAVKVLSPRLARNEQFVAQFLREARAAGRLNHPNIVAAIDVGEDGGFYYFAMEFVDGETLAQRLRREGPLPEDQAIQVAAEVARALDAAHQRGLVHRDIKPQNIMLTKDGRVRVTDFGLARLVDPDGRATTDSSRFVGTPAYMAPEQVRADPDIDCRADIFSLGVTLFEMTTGERPFAGANTVALAAAVIAEPLPSIRKLRPDASLAFCRVIEKMTAKDRADRYATPADVANALEAAAAAPRLRARSGTVPARRPSRSQGFPTGALLAILFVIAAIIGIVLLVNQASRRQSPPPPPPETVEALPPPELPTVPTPTPVPTTPGQKLFERLQQAVAEAEQFVKQQPKAFASQIRRYRRILDDFPPEQQVYLPREGIQSIEKAATIVQRIRTEALQAARVELKERDDRAHALLQAGKIPDAVRLFDTFPTELLVETAEVELAASRRRVRERLEKLYQDLDTQAKARIAQKEYDAAKALYASVKTWNVAEFTERADAALGHLTDLVADQTSEAARAARLAFRKVGRAILDHLAARQYTEAQTALTAALAAAELKPVADRVRELQAILTAVRDLFAHAGLGVQKYKPGEVVRIGGVAGQFDRFHEERVYLKVDEVTIAKSLSELKAREIVDLALAGYGDPAAQVAAVPTIAIFLLAEGDAEAARRGLEAAQAKGQDVAAALDLVQRYGVRPCPKCKGEKQAACPECEGKGSLDARRAQCEACEGRGRVLCPRCGGRETIPCRICKGSGRLPTGNRCAACQGNGRVTCTFCRNGRVRCNDCKGEGFLTQTIPCLRCQGKKTVLCTACDGKGQLPPLELTRSSTGSAAPAPPESLPPPKAPPEPPKGKDSKDAAPPAPKDEEK